MFPCGRDSLQEKSMQMYWKCTLIYCWREIAWKKSFGRPITSDSLHLFVCAEQHFACIITPVFMERKHKWYVESILCQNVFDIPASPPNKAKEALYYIGNGRDIDMAFWWHYEASLISPYCVVTASNHTSSLAWGEALNARLSWCTKFTKVSSA